GVLRKCDSGSMEVTAAGQGICRIRLRETARERLRQAVQQGLAVGLSDEEMIALVRHEARQGPTAAPTVNEGIQVLTKPTHESSHRDPSGIQALPGQGRPRSS